MIGFYQAFWFAYFSITDGLVDQAGYLIGRDFINYWSGATLVVEGRIDAVFDSVQFDLEQERLIGHPFADHYWSYPPHLLLLIRPLALLDYLPAYLVWISLTFIAFVWSARQFAVRFMTQFGGGGGPPYLDS